MRNYISIRPWDDNSGGRGKEVLNTDGEVVAYTRDSSPSIYLPGMGGHEVTLSQEQAHDLCEALQLLL